MDDKAWVVITGANTGLGFETARAVLACDAPVVLACRSVESGERAKAALVVAGADVRAIEVEPLDVSDFAAVRRFAAKPRRVQALICNAGIQIVNDMRRAPNGFELTFATNHLGHFLLARQLLTSMSNAGCIAFVTSNTHDPRQWTGMPAPNTDDLEALAMGTAFADESIAVAGRRRYTTSKLCNVLCAYELARRLQRSSVASQLRVCAFDPGLMPGTGIAREYGPAASWAWHHALPLLTAIVPNVNRVRVSARRLADIATGRLAIDNASYVSGGRLRRSSAASYDTELAARLWTASSRWVDLAEDVELAA
jgi:NAD(P)-dependent dehydrogenase (short-subunit alcohol dehydrogenase family)